MPGLVELLFQGELDPTLLERLNADLCPNLKRLQDWFIDVNQLQYVQSRWSPNRGNVTQLVQVSVISGMPPALAVLESLRELRAGGTDVTYCCIEKDGRVRNWFVDKYYEKVQEKKRGRLENRRRPALTNKKLNVFLILYCGSVHKWDIKWSLAFVPQKYNHWTKQ